MTNSNKEDGRPSFQFYPKDWLSDTELRMCSLEARGLWIDMLCIMWNAPVRGVLMFSPDGICHSKIDGKRMARILGCHEDAISRAVEELVEMGVASIDSDGFLYCRRMKREAKISEVRSQAGKSGAEKRWNCEEKIAKADFAMAKTMANDGPPSSSSSSSATASPYKNKKHSAHPGFEEFWEAYPKKRNKGDAEKAWKKLNPPLATILDALDWQREQPSWTKDGGQFVPYPASYLNAKGWEDEPVAPPEPFDPFAGVTRPVTEEEADWMMGLTDVKPKSLGG